MNEVACGRCGQTARSHHPHELLESDETRASHCAVRSVRPRAEIRGRPCLEVVSRISQQQLRERASERGRDPQSIRQPEHQLGKGGPNPSQRPTCNRQMIAGSIRVGRFIHHPRFALSIYHQKIPDPARAMAVNFLEVVAERDRFD